MSSFDSDDEDVRVPDEVYCEKLVEDVFENNNNNNNDDNHDLELAIQKSLEEYIIQNNEFINNEFQREEDDENMEKIIFESILEECERIEKEEKLLKEKYEEECKEFISKKELKYKYFLSKLNYMITNENKRNVILHIFQKYINTKPHEKYTYITNEEFDLFNKFMNYIYFIPTFQNKRSPINKDDTLELVNHILNKDIQFNYENNENYIKEINLYFN